MCGAFDVIDLPVKTRRQLVPPEAPIVHRLDMRSPPFLREPIEHADNTPGNIIRATLKIPSLASY